jgi:hypothetical protein
MKFFGKAIVALSWLAAVVGGFMIAAGIADGRGLAAAILVFGLAYLINASGRRIDTLERRIARLEDNLGEHQRWHGHLTDY